MLIQVAFSDYHYGFFEHRELERLLELRQIARFRRSTGWVVVGKDPTREDNSFLLTYASYNGTERRQHFVNQ